MDDATKLAKLQRLKELKQLQWECGNPQCDGLPHNQFPFRHARGHQQMPSGDWRFWLILTGRGWGKSLTGANFIVQQALSHPKTEWAVIAPTYRDVKLVCFGGKNGILARIPADRIKKHDQAANALYLTNGSVIYGFTAEDPVVGPRGRNLSGAWCVAKGELVATARGDIPIEDVRAGDKVLTRDGYRRVLRAQQTGVQRDTLRITTDAGTLVCTPDHKVWADGRWLCAYDVAPGMPMTTVWKTHQNQDHPPTSPGTNFAGIATPRTATTASATDSYSTMRSGYTPTDLSLPVVKSTTKTTTEPTTQSATSRVSPKSNIAPTMPSFGSMHHGLTSKHPTLLASGSVHSGLTGKPSNTPVPSAVEPISALECEPSSAATTVVRPSTVLSVEPGLPCDVYDLTIDGAHEFFASRHLVHNCDELAFWRYPQVWTEQLLPALRESQHFKVIVTTTPRKMTVLSELLKRTDGKVHITRGTTFDNSALPADYLEEMRASLDGTRAGRAELYGELLEDIQGALWNRELIQYGSVDADELIRIVVAIDPAGSHKLTSDETGIIVAGKDVAGQVYILEDLSGRYTPDAWAQAAVHAYEHWNADCIVAETNFGAEMVESVIKSVSHVPRFKELHASRGKALRAEPVVGLYEQNKVFHTANLVELETQMCEWVPKGQFEVDERGVRTPIQASTYSPDRVDALVWAITELALAKQKAKALVRFYG